MSAIEDFSLDDLLADSIKQVQEQKAAKELQSRIRSGKASKDDLAKAGEVELKLQWEAVANCEMWQQVCCQCGSQHATFLQHMVEYSQKFGGSASRWRAVEPEELREGLPVKAIFQTREVFHCSECSAPPEGAEIIIWDDQEPAKVVE